MRSKPRITLRLMINSREWALKPPAAGSAVADADDWVVDDCDEVGVVLVRDEVVDADDDDFDVWVASADLAEFTPVTAPNAPDRNWLRPLVVCAWP